MTYKIRSDIKLSPWNPKGEMDYLLGRILTLDPNHRYDDDLDSWWKVPQGEFHSEHDPAGHWWAIYERWLEPSLNCLEFWNAL